MASWKRYLLGELLQGPIQSGVPARKPKGGGAVYEVIDSETVLSPDRVIPELEVADRYIGKAPEIQSGDILMIQRGPEHAIGQSILATEDDSKRILSANLLSLRINPTFVHPEYLQWYFKSPDGPLAIKQITHGTTLLGFKKNDLVQLQIPLPPLDIQKALVDRLSTFDEAISELQSQTQTLQELRDVVLEGVVSGELEISEKG